MSGSVLLVEILCKVCGRQRGWGAQKGTEGTRRIYCDLLCVDYGYLLFDHEARDAMVEAGVRYNHKPGTRLEDIAEMFGTTRQRTAQILRYRDIRQQS
jgi:hypothetical protein